MGAFAELQKGTDPSKILDLLSADPAFQSRQFGIVDLTGRMAGHSGLTNGYALGWPTVDRSSHRAIAALGGARSALFIYPDDDLAVVVLTNLQGAQPERMLDQIASFFVPDIKSVVAKTP